MADFGLVSGSARFGTDSGAAPTGNATANVKGAYAEIVASLAIDADMLRVRLRGNDSIRRWAWDIAVGAAGSEQIIIPDLQFGMLDGYGGPLTLDIPISVKAGSRLSARVQSTTGAEAATINVLPIALPFLRMSNLTGPVDVIGFDSANTIGKNLAPADTWVEMVASTAYRYRAIFVVLSSGNNITTHADTTVSIGVGAAASEQLLTSSYHIHRVTVYDWYPCYIDLSQIDIPAGSRIVMKANPVGVAVYATLYGVR